jgi:hypothetical protein
MTAREALESIAKDERPDGPCRWCTHILGHYPDCPTSIARRALAEMDAPEPSPGPFFVDQPAPVVPFEKHEAPAPEPAQAPSRSVARREAVQRGEPMPEWNAPEPAQGSRPKCIDCGVNDADECFTVCGPCWDKAYAPAPAPAASGPDAEMAAMHLAWWKSDEAREALGREHHGAATAADLLLLAEHEVRECLDSLPPSAPKNGRHLDPFHAGCAALRAFFCLLRAKRMPAPSPSNPVPGEEPPTQPTKGE